MNWWKQKVAERLKGTVRIGMRVYGTSERGNKFKGEVKGIEKDYLHAKVTFDNGLVRLTWCCDKLGVNYMSDGKKGRVLKEQGTNFRVKKLDFLLKKSYSICNKY